ncbi:MAG: hypothetical protein Aurels2KO_35350 [Aureliella sp.]
MSFVRRYWIAGLVICLVISHALIIGYVRSEATRIKVAASNEIPIGVYYVQSADKNWLTQLRVHLEVEPAKRLASKATIEHHRWLIHEVIEEKLRQIDPALLQDAVLLEIKDQIKVAIQETLQEELVSRVLVNDRVDIPVSQFSYRAVPDLTESEPIYTSAPAVKRDIEEVEP